MQKLISRVTDPVEREKGFTLIELLVVIIIIGVLAAIAIPIFLNQKKKAAAATLKSDVRNAVAVVESATTDNQTANVATTGAVSGPSKAALAGDANSQVVVSSGNKLQVIAGSVAGTYCVVGSNPNASPSALWYSSSTGSYTTTAPTTVGDPCKAVAAP